MHAPLSIQMRHCAADLPARELLDDGLERGSGCRTMSSRREVCQPGFLELLIGAPGVDGLMLPHITDEDNAVVDLQVMEERCASARCWRGSTRRAHTAASGRLAAPRSRVKCRCKVYVSMPASPSFCAAREVGASPSTV